MTLMYRVRRGDNLWDISQQQLGDPSQWRRIWRYNNRRDVIARTGRGIPDPDLIYPDQRLLMPILPGMGAGRGTQSPSSNPASQQHASTAQPNRAGRPQPLRNAPRPSEPLAQQLPHIQSPISFKYKLDDIKFPPIPQPGVTLEMKMTGDVVLISKKTVPALYVTSRREIELQMATQAYNAFGTLINDTRLIYDDVGRKMTYRSMLVAQSNTPNVPSTALGVEFNSQSPIPKLRYEIRLPKLEGSLRDFLFVAMGVTIVIEATPNPTPPTGPRAQPLRAPRSAPTTNWNQVIGTGLMITGTAIIVGTLVEDFFTAGVGVADDPPSFAAAAAAIARGRALWNATGVLLPRVAIPATAAITIKVMPAHAQQPRHQ